MSLFCVLVWYQSLLPQSAQRRMSQNIYGFNSVIKYVVFVNPVRCEVICTENIPYLIHLMPWEYLVYPMQVCTVSTVSNITMPVAYAEGDEDDDRT